MKAKVISFRKNSAENSNGTQYRIGRVEVAHPITGELIVMAAKVWNTNAEKDAECLVAGTEVSGELEDFIGDDGKEVLLYNVLSVAAEPVTELDEEARTAFKDARDAEQEARDERKAKMELLKASRAKELLAAQKKAGKAIGA